MNSLLKVVVFLVAGLLWPACIHAGTIMEFSADVYQINEEGRKNRGQYVVFDMYVAFENADSNQKLLSVFNMNITANADFLHSDAYGGNWQGSYSDPTYGGKPWMDSFITMGSAHSGSPFNAAVDGNFEADVPGTIAADAGWYNPNPNNGQGMVDVDYKVLIGRFVLDSNAVLANDNTGLATLNISGDVSFNYNEPGVYFDSDYQTFSMVVPGPAGMAALAGMGLCGIRRRRQA